MMNLSYFPLHFPSFRVFGPDAASWIHGIVTCDLSQPSPQRVVWGSLLTKQGKVQADLLFVGGQEELFVAVSGGDVDACIETLDSYLVMEDAEIEAAGGEWFVVSGEGAFEECEKLGFHAARGAWGRDELVLLRLSVQEEERLLAAEQFQKMSDEKWLSLRVSLGVPQLGVDYQLSDNLHAAGLEKRTVDWSKGCYLGQEVVCMQEMRGKVKARLVSVRTESGEDLVEGNELRDAAEQPIGTITSRSGPNAIAKVLAPAYEAGTQLLLDKQKLTVRLLGPA